MKNYKAVGEHGKTVEFQAENMKEAKAWVLKNCLNSVEWLIWRCSK